MPPRILRRRYDRTFDWAYDPRLVPQPPSGGGLVGVVWDGLSLNSDDPGIVENVEGWEDSPPLDGHDAERSIADGAAYGPKSLHARIITIHGAATGQRDRLQWFRDQLTARAASRYPGELVVSLGDRTLVADVRAGADRYKQHALGGRAFRYEVTLTAADPLLYEAAWRTAVVRSGGGEDTGRTYPTTYAWQYAVPYLLNNARLVNEGNADAPVYALYEGELTESRLVSDQGGTIHLAPLGAGMRIRVATATLTAEAEGGLSRASYILPGSSAITVAPTSTARWSLYAAGAGSVTLGWRSAWV
jgi:hypothetical protein